MRSSALRILLLAALPAFSNGQSLTDDLVAYWKLDEIVGGRTPDSAGSFDMTAINLNAGRDAGDRPAGR